MTEIKYRLSGFHSYGETPDGSAHVVSAQEAVRGLVWLVIPKEQTDSLLTALSVAPEPVDEPAYELEESASRVADLVLSTEFSNWRDISGSNARRMTKAQRARFEAELSGLRRALKAILTTDDEGLEDFLEGYAKRRAKERGGYTWVYDRTLGGYR